MVYWVILLLLSVTAAQDAEQCKILVLQGGGSLGAYQVGLLKAFLSHNNPANYEYDYISGISAGALNTLGMAMFAKGDEVAAVEAIDALWSSLKSND